jgi:tetratricopeptide (TPR) repeat protein
VNSGGAPAATLVSASPASAVLAADSTAPDTSKPEPIRQPSETAAGANDEGMRLYQEKRYSDAAVKFVQASSLQPNIALYANNAGFAFYRMGRYDDAVKWFQQTIVLDPKRAIAYLNLGDAYVNLQKKPEARDAYEKFLALVPNSKSAPAVREKLKSLQSN